MDTTNETFELAKSKLTGRMVTGISPTSGESIYGKCVNVRLCMSGILVDVQNGEWVRNSYFENVEVVGS